MTLKYLYLVPHEQTDYSLDDCEIMAKFDEYHGEITDEHVAILDACAEAFIEYNNDQTADNLAAYEKAAERVEEIGLAGTFMVCAW